MKIILEEIEKVFYAEVILTPAEIKQLPKNKHLHGSVCHNRRKCNVLLRQEDKWDKEE